MQHHAGRDRSNGGAQVVRAFVEQLYRKARGATNDPAWIFNRRGVGYCMPRPDESGGH